MKIITWNCNGAFRKKFSLLEAFDADVLVIQECENPANNPSKSYVEWAQNFVWHGATRHKGIGVFAKPHINLKKHNWPDNGLKYFLPIRINDKIDLLAVWCHSASSPTFGYIGQLWKYLQINKSLLSNSLIIGDFNSNKIWDVWDRWWNHSDVVKELDDMGIRSLYHEYFKEAQGEETRPTFYLQRNLTKPYHIDYVFAPHYIIPTFKTIQIGLAQRWLPYSDHMPVILEWQSVH